MVIMVLLKVALTCATPEAMFLRSRRRTRAGSFPILDPLWAPHRGRRVNHRFTVTLRSSRPPEMAALEPDSLLLLARNRLGRTLACAGVGMGALPANRQATTVPQPTIAAEIHQPLDVHCHFAPQIALDHIVTIDHFANLEHFLVDQLGDAALTRNPDFPHDFTGFSRPDPMDILQCYDDTLVRRYIDAGNAGHCSTPAAGSISLAGDPSLGQIASNNATPLPLPGVRYRTTLDLDEGY